MTVERWLEYRLCWPL